MTYIALYRKYRPDQFSEVIGQDHVKRTLINAAKKNQLSHAYLFSGPRGTGKTTVARILARAANCLDLQDGEPCGKCENCVSISSGVWGIVEIDGASHNSVEDIRDLQEVIHHIPMKGNYTVYIIDEVHMLSRPAFNAFLKTLEEPPAHAKFILATTEPFRLPKTILSRCQHFAFTHIPLEDIAKQVLKIAEAEGVSIEKKAAEFLALHGRGSMRDTISLLDQAFIYSGDKVTLKSVKELLGTAEEAIISDIVDAMIEEDPGKLIELVDSIITSGQDLPEIASAVINYLRNLMLVKAGVKNERILGYVGKELPKLTEQSNKISEKAILKSLDYLGETTSKMRFDIDQRLGFETALLGTMSTLNEKEEDKPQQPSRAQTKTTQPSPRKTIEEKKTSFPPRKSTSDEDKGILRPAIKKDKPKPSSEDQKKKLTEDFTLFWSEFMNHLMDQDIPLMILASGTIVQFADRTISIEYSSDEEYRYLFAIDDNVATRIGESVLSYCGESIQVRVSFSDKSFTADTPQSPLLDPAWSAEVQKSDKVKWENLIKENFMSFFPEGKLEWYDDQD